MDSSASESENESIQTDDSEHNYIPGLPPIVYDSIEVECVGEAPMVDQEPDVAVGAYADEPVADEEWLAKYQENKQNYDKRLQMLQDRLVERVDVSNWWVYLELFMNFIDR